MRHHAFALILLISSVSSSVYGQTLPETNNKTHYDNLTAKREIAVLYRKLTAGYAFDELVFPQFKE